MVHRSTTGVWHGTASNSNSGFRFQVSGFTLVELLVVIAIIAILASLLVPTLGKSLRRAHASQCASNLRQIGVAIRMYAMDHQGRYPLGFKADDANWTCWLNEYLGGVRMTNETRPNERSTVIMCPAQGGKRGMIISGYSAHPTILVNPSWSPASEYPAAGVPCSVVKRPSEVVLMMDGLLPDEETDANRTFIAVHPYATESAWHANPSEAETAIDLDFGSHNEVGLGDEGSGWPHWRHDGSVNTLRVDGHVESLKLADSSGNCEFKQKHVSLNY